MKASYANDQRKQKARNEARQDQLMVLWTKFDIPAEAAAKAKNKRFNKEREFINLASYFYFYFGGVDWIE